MICKSIYSQRKVEWLTVYNNGGFFAAASKESNIPSRLCLAAGVAKERAATRPYMLGMARGGGGGTVKYLTPCLSEGIGKMTGSFMT